MEAGFAAAGIAGDLVYSASHDTQDGSDCCNSRSEYLADDNPELDYIFTDHSFMLVVA